MMRVSPTHSAQDPLSFTMPTPSQIATAGANSGASLAKKELLPLIEALTKRIEDLEAKVAELSKKEPTNNINISVNSVASPLRAPTCFRCGRTGHYAGTCYAVYHINGYKIDG